MHMNIKDVLRHERISEFTELITLIGMQPPSH
jgi:hypothetical protein